MMKCNCSSALSNTNHQAMSHVGFGLVMAVDRQGHVLHGKVSGSPADQIQELEVGDR